MDILDDDFIEFMNHVNDDFLDRRAEPRRQYSNPFHCFGESEFLRRYRFPKDTVRDYILPMVYGDNNDLFRGLPIPSEIKITTALRFYATGSYQTVCGDIARISQPSVCRIVKEVSELLARQLPQVVYFPRTQAQIHVVKNDFHQMGGFPNVMGCVDCSHIPIISPGGANSEVFRNRKGFMSLNVQFVCGPQLQFYDCVTRWPGSTHDSRIFQNSSLRWRLENLRGDLYGSLIIGDSGYGQTKYLFTPVGQPQTPAERRYNRALRSTRATVERAIGVLKRRFPCLLYEVRNHLRTTTRIIAACVVLHNIGRQWDPRDFPLEENDAIDRWGHFDVDLTRVPEYRRARVIKNAFISRHFLNR